MALSEQDSSRQVGSDGADSDSASVSGGSLDDISEQSLLPHWMRVTMDQVKSHNPSASFLSADGGSVLALLLSEF